jgi:hypothetical protein
VIPAISTMARLSFDVCRIPFKCILNSHPLSGFGYKVKSLFSPFKIFSRSAISRAANPADDVALNGDNLLLELDVPKFHWVVASPQQGYLSQKPGYEALQYSNAPSCQVNTY